MNIPDFDTTWQALAKSWWCVWHALAIHFKILCFSKAIPGALKNLHGHPWTYPSGCCGIILWFGCVPRTDMVKSIDFLHHSDGGGHRLMKAHWFIDVSDDSTLQGPRCHHNTMFGGRHFRVGFLVFIHQGVDSGTGKCLQQIFGPKHCFFFFPGKTLQKENWFVWIHSMH